MAKRHAFNSLEFHDEAHKENLTELKSLLSETELNVNGMNVRMGHTFGCAAIPDQSEKAKNEIKEAINAGETENRLSDLAFSNENKLSHSGYDLLLRGVTSLEEILRVTSEK